MDPTRFDRIAITVGRRTTRRGILSLLPKATVGTTLAALVAMSRSDDAAARCRKLGEICSKVRQCCHHEHNKRTCGVNQHSGAPSGLSCYVPKGKRCGASSQCCGVGEVQCIG